MRWFAPLKKDHPLIHDPNHKCPVCKEMFEAGDITGLIPVQAHGSEGPDDKTVLAIPVHKKCYLPRSEEN